MTLYPSKRTRYLLSSRAPNSPLSSPSSQNPMKISSINQLLRHISIGKHQPRLSLTSSVALFCSLEANLGKNNITLTKSRETSDVFFWCGLVSLTSVICHVDGVGVVADFAPPMKSLGVFLRSRWLFSGVGLLLLVASSSILQSAPGIWRRCGALLCTFSHWNAPPLDEVFTLALLLVLSTLPEEEKQTTLSNLTH